MRQLTRLTAFVAVLTLVAVPAFSDTLVLKSGEKVSGYFEGGSARVIKFRMNDGSVKEYDLFTVQQIQFGDDKSSTTSPSAAAGLASPPPAANLASPRPNNTGEPRLLPGTERVTQPVASNAA